MSETSIISQLVLPTANIANFNFYFRRIILGIKLVPLWKFHIFIFQKFTYFMYEQWIYHFSPFPYVNQISKSGNTKKFTGRGIEFRMNKICCRYAQSFTILLEWEKINHLTLEVWEFYLTESTSLFHNTQSKFSAHLSSKKKSLFCFHDKCWSATFFIMFHKIKYIIIPPYFVTCVE